MPSAAFMTRPGQLLRVLPPLAALGCVALLLPQLARLDPGLVLAALTGHGPLPWIGAVLLACVACLGMGVMEVALQRSAGEGRGTGRIIFTGMQAGALVQMTGFGPAVGTAVRWRALPGIGPGRAAALSVLVAAGFTLSAAVLFVLAAAVARGVWAPAVAVLLLCAAVAARLRPMARLPGLTAARAAAVLAGTALDLGAAAAGLALFLPPAALPDPATLFAIYILAATLGLMSQVPGGAGPFDLALLALLPGAAGAEATAAAILAHRLCAHALPAGVAAATLLMRPRVRRAPVLSPPGPAALAAAMARAPAGEWGLIRQGAGVLMTRDRGAGFLVRRAGPVLVAIGPALGRPGVALLAARARGECRIAAHYKAGPRDAARARAASWCIMRLAEEALVDPTRWSADVPAARGLRRKRRAAALSGLSVALAQDPLPHAEMAAVAADWRHRHGRERGFSMGRHAPDLLRTQVVILGHVAGRLVGYASFLVAGGTWTLDLMRWRQDAPDGTMHALVAAGIDEARARGVTRLSLAAVPTAPDWLPQPLAVRLRAPGLRQFKDSFAPRWEARHLCAPGPLRLGLALLAVTLAIHRPRGTPSRARFTPLGVAPPPAPCDAVADGTPHPRPPSRPDAQKTGPTHDRRPFPPA